VRDLLLNPVLDGLEDLKKKEGGKKSERKATRRKTKDKWTDVLDRADVGSPFVG